MAYDRDSRQPPPASTAPDGSSGPVRPPVPVSIVLYWFPVQFTSVSCPPTILRAFAYPQTMHMSKFVKFVFKPDRVVPLHKQ